ncbi:MAG: tetratricopeptide repeat protein [Thermoflexus sp.]|uniref:tetratricopeptide repeat protein n=2 Tax=Thermoflexus sp. TaxID=1969742 RepID=UPI0025D44483|nr:tetratricopeptide repeat protein [Thermoflexus sp.]MCS6964814.1 tetratricopeptide repeat protein [Thermoflexus sp.]MDW8186155.1 tetratricopeptide repeat protein [Anaerolineae bacterium]
MQEITLSQYCAEIERLLQDEAYDEAIAHCFHILKRYPKYYKAYRLLGQAYLEKGQDEAAMDLFARSLSADPEDFLPRIGLSVLYERQGKIAEAAWQMERAYEILPYNEFIREELTKLYARRDGMPLEFLPLTRGALARLYARGHLYAAAIAELESLLQEAPRRYDLRALYIEVMWRDGRRLEAARAAQSLLQELPYCLKANLILGEFWMASGREADARELFRRAAAVDPELALAPDLLGPTASIQPASVRIERLMYAPPTPAYARPPVEEGEIPEWLQALGLPLGEAVPSVEAPPPAGPEEILWSVPETLPTAEIPEEAPPEPISEPLEWLRSVEVAPPPEEEIAAPAVEEVPEWVQAAEAPAPSALPELKEAVPEAPLPQIEWPEWLKEDFVLPPEPPLPPEEELPSLPEVPWEEEEFPGPELPGPLPVEEAGVVTLPEGIERTEEAPFEIPFEVPEEEFPPEAGLPAEVQRVEPAGERSEGPSPELAGLPPLPESLSPEEALAWLARIAEGKEEALRAQAEREAEARMAEILGRRPPETREPAPPPEPVEVMPSPELPGISAGEEREEAAVEEEAALPEWLLALKPPEEVLEAAPAEEAQFQALLEEAAAQPLEIPSEWMTEIGLFPKATPAEAPPVTEEPPVEAMPAEVPAEVPLTMEGAGEEEITFEAVPGAGVPEVPEVAAVRTAETPPSAAAPIWDLLAVDEGVPPAGKVPEPLPPVDLRWLERLQAVPIAEMMAGPLLGILTEYEARLKEQPRDHETRLAMARLLFNLGDTARAVREYQRLLRVSSMRDTVIADLEQAVQLRPNESRLWQVLGDAYQEAGKLQKALEAYRRALSVLS